MADVLLVLEDDTEALVDQFGCQLASAERDQGGRPVERLGDFRHLGEVGLAEAMDEPDDLAGESLGCFWHARENDLVLLLGGWIVDPVVQAPSLERVVDLARPVRREDHARGLLRANRAELRDGDLEVRQDLEQVRLEFLVGPVDLVDQQHRRHAVVRLEGLEERPSDQEFRPEDVVGRCMGRVAARLQQPDLEHLARVVPLVDRRVDVQPLVALEANEPCAEAGCQHLGKLGLADPRFALESSGRPSSRARKTAVASERSVM